MMNPSSPRMRIALIAAVIAVWSCASAADKDVEALLSHMRSAYGSVSAATFTTETTVYTAEDGSPQFTLDFAYKKPGMIRTILKGGGLPEGTVVTIVSDGKNISVTAPQGSPPAQPYSADNFEKAVGVVNLESMCFYDADRQLSTAKGKNMEKSSFKLIPDEEWEGKHWIVLEETAAKDNVLVRYFIDPKTYFIWRTDVKELSTKKDQMDAHIVKLDAAAKLSDDDFKGG